MNIRLSVWLPAAIAFFVAACGGISSLGNGSGSDGIQGNDQNASSAACAGKPCGALCNDCKPGEPCPEIAKYCSAGGTCSLAYPLCEIATCENHSDCVNPEGPCQQCPDGSVACPSASCIGGLCISSFDSCSSATCESDSDCPVSNAPCQPCGDGSYACPTSSCIQGRCAGSIPGCSGHAPCAGKACGESCTQCAPNDPACSETLVLKTCDASGHCTPGQAQCGGACKVDNDCPGLELCKACPGGGCANVACLGGTCGWKCPSDDSKAECTTAKDCSPHILICQECSNGGCAEMDCVAGQCRFVCK